MNEPLTFEGVLTPVVTNPVNANIPLISDVEEDVIVSVPLPLE